MPVYEYECQDCGRHFEEQQRISDNPLKTCKFCGGTVVRLISRTSFALKGGGWYKEGYSKPAPDPKKPATEKTAAPPKKKAGEKTSPGS